MANRTEFSNVDGLLGVRHANKEESVVAAFLFSSAEKACEAAEVFSKKKEEEFHAHCDESTLKRPLSPIQQRFLEARQDFLFVNGEVCRPDNIVVFSAFQGDRPEMREISSSEELAKRVAKIMPQGNSAEDVSVVRDLNGIHIKR